MLNKIQKLPKISAVKRDLPLSKALAVRKKNISNQIKAVLSGKDKRFLVVVGPCSAHSSEAVLEYVDRLANLKEKISSKILLVPRIFSAKPRSRGGFLGMALEPDSDGVIDITRGIIKTRQLFLDILTKYDFSPADELLYPEIYEYLSDLICYSTLGARSTEDMLHKMYASTTEVAIGVKNAPHGGLLMLINSILSAQTPSQFCHKGWQVAGTGNPFAHAVLRGRIDNSGESFMNYSVDEVRQFTELYLSSKLKNPAIIIDASHANSQKKADFQLGVARYVLDNLADPYYGRLIRGIMIESFLEDGKQTEPLVFGKSITDECLGWQKTYALLHEIFSSL